MNRTRYFTNEINLEAFKAGIFLSRASVCSSVVVSYTELSRDPLGFQTLEDTCEGGRNILFMKEALQQFGSFVGVAGAGQYSLMNGNSVGAFARFDIRFRHPMYEEMERDLQNYGDQVVGPLVDEAGEEYKNNASFDLLGKRHVFLGPLRISDFVFNTCVFEGPKLQCLNEVIARIENNSGKDPLQTPQAYHYFHAKGGDIEYTAFGSPERYDLNAMRKHGNVYKNNDSLWFIPHESFEEKVVDFTSMLVKN